MRVLFLNQAFYPDVVSTAQHATDLALELAAAGHEVSVLASRRAYDDPGSTFTSYELWQGIRIHRISNSGLGKAAIWRRLTDSATFALACVTRLARARPFDVVIALTSPPLIAFLAACFVRLKGGKLLYWVMDLNPDEALALGLLRSHDLRTKLLEAVLRFTLQTADRIVGLDRFMEHRIRSRGLSTEKIATLPPWTHDEAVRYSVEGRRSFREAHGLAGKFVVMYSGNHSACHPLDTLLAAAERLSEESGIVFCFVGGGTEHRRIKEYARSAKLSNLLCLPYQPLERLSDSLSAADLHVVVMGEAMVGIVHPCKVYNILRLEIPLLYIGPGESHITDLAAGTQSADWFYAARHGDPDRVIQHILQARRTGRPAVRTQGALAAGYSQRVLAGRLVGEVELLGGVAQPELARSAHA